MKKEKTVKNFKFLTASTFIGVATLFSCNIIYGLQLSDYLNFISTTPLTVFAKEKSIDDKSYFFTPNEENGDDNEHDDIMKDDDDDITEGDDDNDDDDDDDNIVGVNFENLHEDYCTSDGQVCAYHNICYDATEQSWFTASDPIPNTQGHPVMNDMNYTKASDSRKEKTSGCNKLFVPEPNVPFPKADEIIYEEGTTYLVCCWVNHFGHILLQMMVSAVHALDRIGLGDVLKSNKMNFLVDNRAVVYGANGSGDIVMNVFDFLTGRSNSVISLQDLEAESRQYEKQNICFEKLVVGMVKDDLVHPADDGLQPGAEVGMIDLLREHVKNIYPLTKESRIAALNETLFKPDDDGDGEEHDKTVDLYNESPPECTITFLRRKFATRVISNFDEVMNATEKIFHEDKWNIRTVSFDGPSMESQFLTVQSSMVFVSVSGTGSHLGMFLPDGGTSIEILYNNIAAVKNKYICEVSPNMNCLAVKSGCEDVEYWNCKKTLNTEVNIESLEKSLESVKIDLSNKCDEAMESFTRIGI